MFGLGSYIKVNILFVIPNTNFFQTATAAFVRNKDIPCICNSFHVSFVVSNVGSLNHNSNNKRVPKEYDNVKSSVVVVVDVDVLFEVMEAEEDNTTTESKAIFLNGSHRVFGRLLYHDLEQVSKNEIPDKTKLSLLPPPIEIDFPACVYINGKYVVLNNSRLDNMP